MNIKNKINKNRLTTTNTDKRKTLVILTQEEYKHKIRNLMQENQFIMINKNLTQQYHKIIKESIKNIITSYKRNIDGDILIRTPYPQICKL
jgi:hypothetical protein